MVAVSPVIVSYLVTVKVLQQLKVKGVRAMARHLFTALQIFSDCLLVAS